MPSPTRSHRDVAQRDYHTVAYVAHTNTERRSACLFDAAFVKRRAEELGAESFAHFDAAVSLARHRAPCSRSMS
jgi:hypothetical protein